MGTDRRVDAGCKSTSGFAAGGGGPRKAPTKIKGGCLGRMRGAACPGRPRGNLKARAQLRLPARGTPKMRRKRGKKERSSVLEMQRQAGRGCRSGGAPHVHAPPPCTWDFSPLRWVKNSPNGSTLTKQPKSYFWTSLWHELGQRRGGSWCWKKKGGTCTPPAGTH